MAHVGFVADETVNHVGPRRGGDRSSPKPGEPVAGLRGVDRLVVGDQLWEWQVMPGPPMVLHGTGDRIAGLASFVNPRLGCDWQEESRQSAGDR